jgi:cobalamin synthase
VHSLLAALQLMTGRRVFDDAETLPETARNAAVFFPLAGLTIGLVLVACNYLLAPRVDPQIINLVLITVMIAMTGAQSLQGTRTTFDAIYSAHTAPIIGTVAVTLMILFKNAALNALDERLNATLLLSPVLARWALLLFLFGYYARFDATCRGLARHLSLWSVLTGSVATIALTVYLFGRTGLWIALLVSVFALLLRAFLYHKHGVLSPSHLGALVEMVEVLALCSLASIS